MARPWCPVALTRRAALAALTGALVVLGFRTTAGLLAVNGVLLAAIAAPPILAGGGAGRPRAHAQPPRVALRIPARGRATLTTALTPDRRGEKVPGSVTVRSLGPCGLAGRQGRHVAAWTVRALPPFRSRRHLPEKLSRLRQLDGQHRSLLRGQGTEFDSLREYVIGDDVRSIDWRAAARSRDVMVRTWRPERDRRILVVLDTGRTSAGRVAGVPRLD